MIPFICTMDRPGFAVSRFIGNFIGLKGLKIFNLYKK